MYIVENSCLNDQNYTCSTILYSETLKIVDLDFLVMNQISLGIMEHIHRAFCISLHLSMACVGAYSTN